MQVDYACEPSRLPFILPALSEWTNELFSGKIRGSASTFVAVLERTVSLVPACGSLPHDGVQCGVCHSYTMVVNSFCMSCQKYRDPLSSIACGVSTRR